MSKIFVAKIFIMFNILEFLFAHSSINFYARRRRQLASQSTRQGVAILPTRLSYICHGAAKEQKNVQMNKRTNMLVYMINASRNTKYT